MGVNKAKIIARVSRVKKFYTVALNYGIDLSVIARRPVIRTTKQSLCFEIATSQTSRNDEGTEIASSLHFIPLLAMTIGWLFRNLKIAGLFFIIFFAFNIFFIAEANAGFLSFIEKIWNFGEENKESSQSAALMPLLEAPKNSDLLAGKNLGSINIVGGNALFANSGPLGTILDIQNLPATQISIYTVREGDTLSGIAEMFNVDTNTIRYANNIKRGGVIKPGGQLVILPIPGIRYSIKKGDTVKSIAKKFGSEEDDIIAFNDVDLKNGLSEGDVIIIPNGELQESEHLEPKHSLPAAAKKKGNTLAYPLYTGYYARPVYGGIKTQGIHGYNGVDLADGCGSPIYAAADGDVIIERSWGYNGGYGKYLVISHTNGTQTLYSHNSSNVVKEGSYVKKGQLIGYIGLTGRTTGCHLHFEIRGAKNPF